MREEGCEDKEGEEGREWKVSGEEMKGREEIDEMLFVLSKASA